MTCHETVESLRQSSKSFEQKLKKLKKNRSPRRRPHPTLPTPEASGWSSPRRPRPAHMVAAAAALGLLLLAGPGPAPAVATAPFQDQVDALAKEYGRRYNASFAVAVVDANSGSVYEAAHGPLRPWSVDAPGAAPMTAESLFPVGSATKPFTAVAILQLVEAGELSLDTKVHEVVDDWLGEPLAALIPANNSMIEQVTVGQLLAHTSGLPDYEDENIRAWTLASPKGTFSPFDYIK